MFIKAFEKYLHNVPGWFVKLKYGLVKKTELFKDKHEWSHSITKDKHESISEAYLYKYYLV